MDEMNIPTQHYPYTCCVKPIQFTQFCETMIMNSESLIFHQIANINSHCNKHNAYQIEIKIVKLQILQSFIQCFWHIFWGMIWTPGGIQYSRGLPSAIKGTHLHQHSEKSIEFSEDNKPELGGDPQIFALYDTIIKQLLKSRTNLETPI